MPRWDYGEQLGWAGRHFARCREGIREPGVCDHRNNKFSGRGRGCLDSVVLKEPWEEDSPGWVRKAGREIPNFLKNLGLV